MSFGQEILKDSLICTIKWIGRRVTHNRRGCAGTCQATFCMRMRRITQPRLTKSLNWARCVLSLVNISNLSRLNISLKQSQSNHTTAKRKSRWQHRFWISIVFHKTNRPRKRDSNTHSPQVARTFLGFFWCTKDEAVRWPGSQWRKRISSKFKTPMPGAERYTCSLNHIRHRLVCRFETTP